MKTLRETAFGSVSLLNLLAIAVLTGLAFIAYLSSGTLPKFIQVFTLATTIFGTTYLFFLTLAAFTLAYVRNRRRNQRAYHNH